MLWTYRLSSLDQDKFIIARDVTADGSKVFGTIKMSELQGYMRKVKREDRMFHERIHPNYRQKIFFDIDGDGPHDSSLITPYILTINKCIKRYTSASYQILLFTSSSEDKISYHIIVDGLYVKNIYYNRRFANYVCWMFEKDYPNISCLIDQGVYSVGRFLRICYSRKYGSNRYKTLTHYSLHNTEIIYKDITSKTIILKSLVSYVSKSDRKLSINIYSDPIKSIERQEDSIEIEDAEDIYQSYLKYCKINNLHPLSYRDVNGDIIYLDRIRSSFCPVCEREHSHENAFLSIQKSGIIYKCYRRLEDYVIIPIN